VTSKKLENTSLPNTWFHWNSITIWRQLSNDATDKHAAVMAQSRMRKSDCIIGNFAGEFYGAFSKSSAERCDGSYRRS